MIPPITISISPNRTASSALPHRVWRWSISSHLPAHLRENLLRDLRLKVPLSWAGLWRSFLGGLPGHRLSAQGNLSAQGETKSSCMQLRQMTYNCIRAKTPNPTLCELVVQFREMPQIDVIPSTLMVDHVAGLVAAPSKVRPEIPQRRHRKAGTRYMYVRLVFPALFYRLANPFGVFSSVVFVQVGCLHIRG